MLTTRYSIIGHYINYKCFPKENHQSKLQVLMLTAKLETGCQELPLDSIIIRKENKAN